MSAARRSIYEQLGFWWSGSRSWL